MKKSGSSNEMKNLSPFSGLLILFLLSFITSFAQERFQIKGYVKDESGNPLQGVSVLRKSSQKGVVTDENGYFLIRANDSSLVLVFTSVGYASQTVKLKSSLVATIVLQKVVINQDEVVVIGYGSAKRKDLTGAITTVKPKSTDAVQFNTVDAFLRGRVAGVQVQQNSGAPGGALKVRIRGTNSLRGDNEPLYVVDGVIIGNVTGDNADPQSAKTSNSGQDAQNTLSAINPQDIESVEILKDASATAIYGSRGANGVVIITTKQGKSGKPVIQYSTGVEYAKVSNKLHLLNATDYASYINRIEALAGRTPKYGLDTLQNVDWQNILQRVGVTQTHRLSISGASNDQKTKFYLAGGMKNINGIVKNSGYTQGDMKLNLSQDLNSRLKMNLSISGQYTKNNMTMGAEPLGGGNNSLISKMLTANPIGNAQTELTDPSEPYDNPYSWLNDYDDISNEKRLIASMNAIYKISPIFSYKINVAADYRNKERKRWFGKTTFVGKTANGSLGLSQFNREYYAIENLLLFNKIFNKHHRIDGTIGVTYDNEMIISSSILNENFFSEALRTDGFGYGQLLYPFTRDKSKINLFSLLGRINYSLNNKYLITVSGRNDYSSKFDVNSQGSFFPSVALAWKVKEEKFMKKINQISNLKLRVGYGRTGNQSITPYNTYSRYNQNNYVSGNTLIIGVIPSNIQNKNLTWETTNQYNAGLDIEFFDRRISFTADAYYKQTKDLLQFFTIPTSTGFATIPTNIGTIENKGLEFSITGNIVRKEHLEINVTGNIAFNQNKILALGRPAEIIGTHKWVAYMGDNVSNGTYFKDPANIFIEGYPVGMFYGYRTTGVFQKSDDISKIKQFGKAVTYGDLRISDENGDGDISPEDKVILGNPNPKYVYGFNVDMNYKNLEFSLFFNGVQGNQVVNGNLIRIGNPNGTNESNILQSVYNNAWTDANPTNYPRIGNDNNYFIDRYIEYGSFLRLATASVGYSFKFPNSFIKVLNVNLTGRNLFILTKYTGFDPEVNSFGYSSGKIGVDWNSYPNTKALTAGVNLTF